MESIGLPQRFTFTQQSLSTFEACTRKFRLKYIHRLHFPASHEADSIQQLRRGNDFHLMAYRYFMGIPTGAEWIAKEDAFCRSWMERLQARFVLQPSRRYLPEYRLRITQPYPLEANIDLVEWNEDEMVVWDWKTGMQGRGGGVQASRLLSGWQTVVYMYMIKELSLRLTGREWECSKIHMHYWSPETGRDIAVLEYSDALHESFQKRLLQKIDEILHHNALLFDRAVVEKSCRYCEYKKLCDSHGVDSQIWKV